MKDFLKRSAVIGRTIKSSLAMAIPVLFIGSITVLLNGIPIQAYQDFIASFLGGAIKNIGEIMQLATVGILAIHITIALNFSYMNQTQEGPRLVFRLGSLMSFGWPWEEIAEEMAYSLHYLYRLHNAALDACIVEKKPA